MAVSRSAARSIPSTLAALAALTALTALSACGGGPRLQPAADAPDATADPAPTTVVSPTAAPGTSGGPSTTAGRGGTGTGVVVSGGGVVISGGQVSVDGVVVGSGGEGAVVGSGVLVTEDRGLSGFHAVDVHGFGTVHVTRSDHDSVQVRTDDNVAPLVTTEVRDGRLVIGFAPGTSLRAVTLEITVTAASLDAVAARGSGRLDVRDLAGGPFSLALSGSGDALVSGTASEVTLSVDGSGELDASGLLAERAVVRVNGSGEAAVHATAALDAAVNGSGEIGYHGAPATLTTAVAGSGDIEPA